MVKLINTSKATSANKELMKNLSPHKPNGKITTLIIPPELTLLQQDVGSKKSADMMGRLLFDPFLHKVPEGANLLQISNRFNHQDGHNAQLMLFALEQINEQNRIFMKNALLREMEATTAPYVQSEIDVILKARLAKGKKQGYESSIDRFRWHEAKSSGELRNSFYRMANALEPKKIKHNITEIRGEYLACKFILTSMTDAQNIQLKRGFKRGTGIDQIWVRRNAANGDVLSYILIEAKGSHDASISKTDEHGYQMSPRWVFCKLLELANSDNFNDARMGSKIINAILNRDIPVQGFVIHADFDINNPNDEFQRTVYITYAGNYSDNKLKEIKSLDGTAFK